MLGFGLAFLARADLPLYLVQAGAMSAVGIAAVLGAVLLGWRLSVAEIAVLALLAVGLIMLAGAAVPSQSHDIGPGLGLALLAVLLATVLLAVPATRLPRACGVTPRSRATPTISPADDDVVRVPVRAGSPRDYALGAAARSAAMAPA